jgi:hypothetical protein
MWQLDNHGMGSNLRGAKEEAAFLAFCTDSGKGGTSFPTRHFDDMMTGFLNTSHRNGFVSELDSGRTKRQDEPSVTVARIISRGVQKWRSAKMHRIVRNQLSYNHVGDE